MCSCSPTTRRGDNAETQTTSGVHHRRCRRISIVDRPGRHSATGPGRRGLERNHTRTFGNYGNDRRPVLGSCQDRQTTALRGCAACTVSRRSGQGGRRPTSRRLADWAYANGTGAPSTPVAPHPTPLETASGGPVEGTSVGTMSGPRERPCANWHTSLGHGRHGTRRRDMGTPNSDTQSGPPARYLRPARPLTRACNVARAQLHGPLSFTRTARLRPAATPVQLRRGDDGVRRKNHVHRTSAPHRRWHRRCHGRARRWCSMYPSKDGSAVVSADGNLVLYRRHGGTLCPGPARNTAGERPGTSSGARADGGVAVVGRPATAVALWCGRRQPGFTATAIRSDWASGTAVLKPPADPRLTVHGGMAIACSRESGQRFQSGAGLVRTTVRLTPRSPHYTERVGNRGHRSVSSAAPRTRRQRHAHEVRRRLDQSSRR